MNHTTSAAPRAGAQNSCARTTPAGFAPILRRTLLCALRRCRSDLRLSTGDVLVLDVLLSFLPCRDRATGADRPITPATMPVVYASNATICDRANGMDERVLRRHLARLVSAGLLARRDSATGKRFPLRAGGKVTAAYGLDLSPLLCRHAEITARAAELEAEAEDARALRAEALSLRAGLLQAAERLTAEARDFVERAKTVMRRTTLALSDLAAIRDRLLRLARGQAVLAEVETAEPAPAGTAGPAADTAGERIAARPVSVEPTHVETDPESATNGENVRHEETPKTDTDLHLAPDRSEIDRTWASCPAIAELFPSPPTRTSDLMETVYLLGSFLGVKERGLADAIARMGWLRVIAALDYLVANAARITHPGRYLAKMAADSPAVRAG